MPEQAKQQKPCGNWPSPLSAADIASSSLRLGQTAMDGETVYWIEGRPVEAGRSVLMCYSKQHGMQEVLPVEYNVRSRAHEYGGGAFAVKNGIVCFVHDGDRQLYLFHNHVVTALTSEQDVAYADMEFDFSRNRILCIREKTVQAGEEPVSEIIAIAMDGSGHITVLQSGRDFYSNPGLSADGKNLCWLQWQHPHMPWDSTELMLAELDESGAPVNAIRVAGSDRESVFQPQWHEDGSLLYVSDRSGWWNLYRWQQNNSSALLTMEAEFGLPQWVFGMSTYAIVDNDRVLCAFCEKGVWKLALLSLSSAGLQVMEHHYNDYSAVAASRFGAVVLAAGPWSATEVVCLSSDMSEATVLSHSLNIDLEREDISEPVIVEFETGDSDVAYGFYYAPCNSNYEAAANELPPLIVKSHGGPTGATTGSLDSKIQYWTTRGFAVLDVNYRGSTGYGRAYHEKLNHQWGVVDVEDCIAGAQHLVRLGLADGNRLIITGSSAGGYTTLCALAFHDVFAAGASYYGIGDLEALLRDTHKFESRYFDTLIAPYEGNEALYRERSPLYSAEQLSCPVIFFQGSEDKVVPPQQAKDMVAALQKKAVPVSYIEFEGEGHGFRQAETIKTALESEHRFYLQQLALEQA